MLMQWVRVRVRIRVTVEVTVRVRVSVSCTFSEAFVGIAACNGRVSKYNYRSRGLVLEVLQ